jgi:hypothetical protein
MLRVVRKSPRLIVRPVRQMPPPRANPWTAADTATLTGGLIGAALTLDVMDKVTTYMAMEYPELFYESNPIMAKTIETVGLPVAVFIWAVLPPLGAWALTDWSDPKHKSPWLRPTVWGMMAVFYAFTIGSNIFQTFQPLPAQTSPAPQ